MQRYIYGNLHHAGFRTVSSDESGFFSRYAAELAPMMFYDAASSHGDLPKGAHKCFWMLTTSLNIPGGSEYLFLQESGLDPFRDAAIVQGYRIDPEDAEDIYGPGFPELLKTQFLPSDEALKTAESTQLQSTPFSNLPKTDFLPAKISQGCLEGILLTLLQKRRVIVRLPSTGAEAMKESKQYLMAIYQRLPYEARKINGCLTGATARMLDISDAFTLILMDGDADLEGIETDVYQVVFDLRKNIEPRIPKEDKGKQRYYVPLIEFLASKPEKEIEKFFSFCRNHLDIDLKTGSPSLDKYCSYFDIFTMGKLEAEDITRWAVNLYDNSWSVDLRAIIYQQIIPNLDENALLDYYKERLPDYTSLEYFGALSNSDEEHEKNVQRDQYAALTLRMMLNLPGYDCDSVHNHLVEHVMRIALSQIGGLDNPSGKTVQALNALTLPMPKPESQSSPEQKKTDHWINLLREDIKKQLEQRIAEITKTYQLQYAHQKQAGDRLIAAWPSQSPSDDLGMLYQKLRQHYLYQELLAEWNSLISGRIVAECRSFGEPAQLNAYDIMHKKVNADIRVFTKNGGVFDSQQSQELDQFIQRLDTIVKLSQKECSLTAEFEQWLQDVNGMRLNPTLGTNMKRVAGAKFLQTIPENLPLEETIQRLKCCERHEDLLNSDKILFREWNIASTARDLLRQIEDLQNYHGSGTDLRLNDLKRNWIVRCLSNNKYLMIPIIREKYNDREKLVAILAQNGTEITKEDIQELYVSGCSRKFLCEDVTQNASISWRTAANAFSQTMPDLPAPMKQLPPQKNTVEIVLCGIALMLLALAEIIPTSMLMIFETGTMIIYAVILAVLVTLAVLFVCLGFLQKKKLCRTFLFGIGMAAAPAIVMTIVALVLILI